MGISLFKKRPKESEPEWEEAPPFSPVLQNVRVRMLETRTGCPDGVNVKLYEKGREYSISADLARLFIKMGCAEKI